MGELYSLLIPILKKKEKVNIYFYIQLEVEETFESQFLSAARMLQADKQNMLHKIQEQYIQLI